MGITSPVRDPGREDASPVEELFFPSTGKPGCDGENLSDGTLAPDPGEITRDWVRWQAVDRSEAMVACHLRPVAVVHRVNACPAAAWLLPGSSFYGRDGAYLYEELRYYVFTGGMRPRLKGLRIDKPAQPEDFEPLSVMNEAGEEVNLGSPLKKKPEKKAKPVEFQLTGGDGKALAGMEYEVVLPDGTVRRGESDAEGWIKIPDNMFEGEALLKVFPGHGHLGADATRGSGSPAPDAHDPELGLIADLGISALPQIKVPVEILLVDAKGIPMPDASFTATFPDGKEESGKSDSTGMIRFPDNTQLGDLTLIVTGLEDKAA
jgi:hypothetical protein